MTTFELKENVPAELQDLPHWVVWRSEVRDGNKATKVPYVSRNPRRKASATEPGTWGAFVDAIDVFPAAGCDGIGFVFTRDGGYVGVDFDHAIDDRGRIMDWALPCVESLEAAGAYFEKSPSGTGLHAITRGRLPAEGSGIKVSGFGDDGAGRIEVYQHSRYFTVTGDQLGECEVIGDGQAALDDLYRDLMTKKDASRNRDGGGWPRGDADAAPPPSTPATGSPPPAADRWQVPVAVAPAAERPDDLARARAYLAKCEPAIQGSDGSGRCFKAACKIGPGFDLEQETAFEVLRDHYNKRCNPPWSDAELWHKVESAYKNETRRGWLRDADRPDYRSNGTTAQHHADDPPPAGDGAANDRAKPERDTPKPPEFTGEIRPLKSNLLPVPSLPDALIPGRLRPWLLDIKRRGCFPIEYPTAASIVALGSLLGRRLAIRPKSHDAWTVVSNVWGAIVGPPGIQKSPAVEETLLLLRRLIAEALKKHKEAERQATEDAAVAELLATATRKKQTAAAGKGATESELRRMIAEANSGGKPTPPTLKRYLVNDVTIEKLGELLRENPDGLLQFRDELNGFFRAMDRQGHESDRGFYLESWNGNGAYTFDRIGRGSVHIDALCLSIFGTIQPGPLARYLKVAASGEDADGFVPRFQVLVYPDPPTKFVNVDCWPDTQAKNEAFEIFRWIDAIDPAALGAELDEDRGLRFIRFDDDAQTLFNEWRETLENRLRSGTESAMMTNHLAKYRSLMPSLALIFHVVASCGCDRLPPVTFEAAEQAAAWCDFLESHAQRVYQSAIEGDPELAERLGERIKQSLPNPFTYRDVSRKGWAGFDAVEDVRRAVGILEDRNWVCVIEKPPGPKGGRPTEEVWINPAIRDNKESDN